jgi:hypothetical protein
VIYKFIKAVCVGFAAAATSTGLLLAVFALAIVVCWPLVRMANYVEGLYGPFWALVSVLCVIALGGGVLYAWADWMDS